MSEPKLKSESYANIAGINRKVSPYQNSPQECLNIENMDFSQPGSLTSRPGSTLYGSTLVGKITGLYEFTRLIGASYVVFGASNGLNQLLPSGSTLVKTMNNSYLMDFMTFVDRMFVFNGEGGQRWDGGTIGLFSLPAPSRMTLTGATSVFAGGISVLAAGTYFGAYAYVNERGYLGPICEPGLVTLGNYLRFEGLTAPANRGIIGYAFYISPPGSSQLFLVKGLSIAPGSTVAFGFVVPSIVSGTPISTVDITGFGVGILPFNGAYFAGQRSSETPVEYVSINGGETFSPDETSNWGFTLPGASFNGVIWPFPSSTSRISMAFEPRFAEVYSNRAFYSGLSGVPSTVWFSDLGEPEGILPENFFEVRTNDGDSVSGMSSYQNGLIISKYKSIHFLSGNSPENFDLQEITTEYGNISNRTMIVYENLFWGLDQKGIIQWNGSQVGIISSKIEDVFLSMNLAAAKDNATAIHDRFRNEVRFAIPTDGSTLCNTLVVYDYIANGFAVWKGNNINAMAMVQGSLSSPTSFFGGYSGSIRFFGSSFLTDYGTAFTSVIKFPYKTLIGQSIETQYRRLYLDVDPIIGVTAPVSINLRSNYGATIQAARTMYQNPFQSRIDFGIPARSLSVEVVHSSASCGMRVHGYTIEGREQRRV